MATRKSVSKVKVLKRFCDYCRFIQYCNEEDRRRCNKEIYDPSLHVDNPHAYDIIKEV